MSRPQPKKVAPARTRAVASVKPATTRNDTKHLLGSPVNAKRLKASVDQLKPVLGVSVNAAPATTIGAAEEGVTQIKKHVWGPGAIEDAFRQSGRTSSMLQEAAEKSRDGKRVLIIMKDEYSADIVRSRAIFYPNTDVVVLSHDPKSPEFAWEDVFASGTNGFISPVNKDCVIFVDHAVVYTHLKLAIEHLGWGNGDLLGDADVND